MTSFQFSRRNAPSCILVSSSPSMLSGALSRFMSSLKNFQSTVDKLYSLQSNAEARKAFQHIRTHGVGNLPSESESSSSSASNSLPKDSTQSSVIFPKNSHEKFAIHNSLAEMKHFLKIFDFDINSIPFIHVGGTNGKGSTLCFTEALLRQKGYKTGFFSSPHLVSVTERIRLNGDEIQQSLFTSIFWDLWDRLEKNKTSQFPFMPSYFRYLCLMSFQAFYQEKVDIALLEVGIGGRYDVTNVIDHPVVCGISSLGFDHTEMLGDTLESIAWNKAGIFKKNRPIVLSPQPESVLKVFNYEAQLLDAPISVTPPLCDWIEPLETSEKSEPSSTSSAPSLENHSIINKQILDLPQTGNNIFHSPYLLETLDLQGVYQQINAALALGLVNVFENHKNDKFIQTPRTFSSSLKIPTPNIHFASSLPPLLPAKKISLNERKCILNCNWPGRSEIRKKGNSTWYIDGAHTSSSIIYTVQWFKSQLNHLKNKSNDNLIPNHNLIFYCSPNRDPRPFFRHLLAIKTWNNVYFTSPNDLKSSQIDKVNRLLFDKRVLQFREEEKKMFPEKNYVPIPIHIMPSVEKTCLTLENDKISSENLVVGSLYLVGSFLSRTYSFE